MMITFPDQKITQIIELMNDNQLECKGIHNHCGHVNYIAILVHDFEHDFEYCSYENIVKSVPYSLEYNPELNKKETRGKLFFENQKLKITDEILAYLNDKGFTNTITKIYYFYVDSNNTSFYKILGKSSINERDTYFYVEYQENSMGYDDHKLYLSYEYLDLIKYCMPLDHVKQFVSIY